MKDVNLTQGLDKYKTASDRAVMYFLRRMCEDGRLCWYMNCTGAYEHMLEAGAEICGVSLEEFSRDHNKHKAVAYDPVRAACRECGKIDPDDGDAPDCDECQSRVPDFLGMAVKLIMEMSRFTLDNPFIRERIKIFFESLAASYPDFKLTQCGGVYSTNYHDDVFKRPGDDLEDW